jgi:hypothetical protein
MKALTRRLEKLEKAREPVVDELGQTMLQRLERGYQLLRDAGYEVPETPVRTDFPRGLSIWDRLSPRYHRPL